MRKDDAIRIQHIIMEAEEACAFAENMSLADFTKDRRTVKAIVRSVEIIGEAASKISDEIQNTYPEIPWKQIVGMRNRLIHVYFDIDYRMVWQTVKENLPPLIDKLKRIAAGTG